MKAPGGAGLGAELLEDPLVIDAWKQVATEEAEILRVGQPEAFFPTLTRRRLKHGVLLDCLIAHVEAAIHRYHAEHKDNPMPFTWTTPADASSAG